MSRCPGFGRGFPVLSRASACGLGAARAAGVPRAFFDFRIPAGPARASWQGAPPCGARACDGPCCSRLCVRAPSSMLVGRSRRGRRWLADGPDAMLTSLPLPSFALPPRRRGGAFCLVPGLLDRPAWRLAGPNPCRKAGAVWMLPALLVLCEASVRSLGLVFERESWRGHGAPSLRCRCVAVRLGLVRRNRPAQQISPALRAFLARQICRACRSSTLFRPAVRRTRHLA